MGKGYIVRRGGGGQALAPTITEVDVGETSITFTITNNDASTAVILYEVGDATPDENSIELATGVTSDSIEITGLTGDTTYTVSATASVTGKVLSNVVSLNIDTIIPINYIDATVSAGTTTTLVPQIEKIGSVNFRSDIIDDVGKAFTTDDFIFWTDSNGAAIVYHDMDSPKQFNSLVYRHYVTNTSTHKANVVFDVVGSNNASSWTRISTTNTPSDTTNAVYTFTATTSDTYRYIGLRIAATLYSDANAWTFGTIQSLSYEETNVIATGTYEDSGVTYRYHVFNSSGSFNVTQLSNQGSQYNDVDYLVIAGGGAGAKSATAGGSGGGGGAGGYRTGSVSVSIQDYSVVVGAGGTAPYSILPAGNNGSNSSIFGLSSVGGGGGGSWENPGQNGGSGGGGNSSNNSAARAAGLGTAGQGFNGGAGSAYQSSDFPSSAAGGGGGSSQAGFNQNSPSGSGYGGNGGAGTSSLITGTSITRAGGGGGGGRFGSTGGSGGGGNGGRNGAKPTSGLRNTGSGGGGARNPSNSITPLMSGITGGAGGSGVVIVKYVIGVNN